LRRKIFLLAKHAGDHVEEVNREKRRKEGPLSVSSHYLSQKHRSHKKGGVQDYDDWRSSDSELSYVGSSFDFERVDAEEK
jgi:hypothetical protein